MPVDAETNFLKPLMFVGTASDVGKSTLATAFCRIFKQDGYNPAPFKAQNMSLNSYATPEGFEIGRAQAVQAEAAGIPCHTDMNPVLLKPNSKNASQVILHGKPVGTQSAYDYFRNQKETLFEEVKVAYNRLQAQYTPIVLEGAGSISELNLKAKDIVNMRMAAYAGAAVILVADIERGGIFASVYGSIKLLSPEEQALVKGVIVNKFRGDVRLFEEGVKILEDITGVPVLGVVPAIDDIQIEEEDSVAIQTRHKHPAPGKVNICVVHLPRISNYTDFQVFENLKGVHLYYAWTPERIEQADIVILPGSKNTIEDLTALYTQQIDTVLQRACQQGKIVIGICGGFQMMGQEIADPHGVESTTPAIKGLGLLPVKTTLTETKQTVQKHFYHQHDRSRRCKGYEIHMGMTTAMEGDSPLNYFEDGEAEGYWRDANCWGSYLHGIFDNRQVLQQLFKNYPVEIPVVDPFVEKEKQYDQLADIVRDAVDVEKIYKLLRA